MSRYILSISLLIISCFVFSKHEQSNTKYVTYAELLNSLELVATSLESSEIIKREFSELQKSHGVLNSEEVYREFVRVRLAFEATRDSGLWQLRWAVTDKEPNSDSIWRQWGQLRNLKYDEVTEIKPIATAECDELSALFAFISKGLGVKHVGLF